MSKRNAHLDQRERIDAFDADGKLVDVHRWDPKLPRQIQAAEVRATIIGFQAREYGAVTARILGPDGETKELDANRVRELKEAFDGKA